MTDTNINEIFLVHKCVFDEKKYDTVYSAGRNMDGFVYCISGSAKWIYKDNTTTINEGDLLYLPSSSQYCVQSTSTSFLHYTANFELSVPLSQSPCQLTDARHFKPLFDRLCISWGNKENGFRLKSKAILYEMIFMFLNDISVAGTKTSAYSKIIPARDYLEKHPTETVSTKLLAEICNLSETHFRRLFKELYGKSPTEYQLNIKLLKAEDLLLTELYTISEIAEKCGFADANYFSRLFRARKGISPLRFSRTRLITRL